MTEPVIVPAARVVLKPLLFAFGVLAGYFVAFGLVFCMDAVVRAFFGTVSGAVGWIPFAGKVLTKPLTTIERHLTSYLGGLEAHFERQMAIRWHLLASLVSQLAADTRAAAIYDWQLARKFATLWGNAAIGAVVKGVHTIVKVVRAEVHTVTRKVVHVEKLVGSKADAFVVRRVHALTGEVAHVIDWTIPSLRARDRAIEHSLARLFRWMRAHPLTLPATITAAAVAVALGRLGGSWIQCRNWNRIGRSVCRLPFGLIEELFAGAIVTFAVLDICRFSAAAQAVAEAFVPELMALVDVEDALIGCHGATAAPVLTLPALHLPPTNLGLPLAA